MREILDLVAQYLKTNNIPTTSFSSGRPGKDWFYAFIKRNNLSMNKATMISSARKSATANPFVIYDFYEQLDELVKSKNLSAGQIWNCDESGSPAILQNAKLCMLRVLLHIMLLMVHSPLPAAHLPSKNI